jgi:hypothetical protein
VIPDFGMIECKAVDEHAGFTAEEDFVCLAELFEDSLLAEAIAKADAIHGPIECPF